MPRKNRPSKHSAKSAPRTLGAFFVEEPPLKNPLKEKTEGWEGKLLKELYKETKSFEREYSQCVERLPARIKKQERDKLRIQRQTLRNYTERLTHTKYGTLFELPAPKYDNTTEEHKKNALLFFETPRLPKSVSAEKLFIFINRNYITASQWQKKIAKRPNLIELIKKENFFKALLEGKIFFRGLMQLTSESVDKLLECNVWDCNKIRKQMDQCLQPQQIWRPKAS